MVFIDNSGTTFGKYCGFVAKNTILELQNTASKKFNLIIIYHLHNTFDIAIYTCN